MICSDTNYCILSLFNIAHSTPIVDRLWSVDVVYAERLAEANSPMKSHKRPTFTSKNLKDRRCSARRSFSTIKLRVSPIGVIGRSQRRRLESSFQRLDFGPCYLRGYLRGPCFGRNDPLS